MYGLYAIKPSEEQMPIENITHCLDNFYKNVPPAFDMNNAILFVLFLLDFMKCLVLSEKPYAIYKSL